MRRVVRHERRPCIFYFHPWEIDEGQPRIAAAPLKSRIRHYTNINKMSGRLTRLLRDFSWKRVDEIFPVNTVKVAA
jgi:hypothetical protein